MTWVRRSLRATAIAWLCLQAATLAVFIPQTCCLGHDVRAAVEAHQPECPLHPSKAPEPECRMTAGCGTPMAALPVSITVVSPTVGSFYFEPEITSTRVSLVPSPAIDADTFPATPPPKA